MQFTMNENSLFAILMRSGWWVSFLIAAVMTGVLLVVLPAAYRYAALVSGLPFIVTGCIAAWRQWRAPSRKRIEAVTTAVRAMSWSDFSRALAQAYRKDGYQVETLSGGAADLVIARDFRRTLVLARRWKVARTGVEPLRDLVKQKEAQEAQGCACVTVGEVTDNAREYAEKHGVTLVDAREVARLLVAAKIIGRRGAGAGRNAGREQASSR
jgi:restriction system protein